MAYFCHDVKVVNQVNIRLCLHQSHASLRRQKKKKSQRHGHSRAKGHQNELGEWQHSNDTRKTQGSLNQLMSLWIIKKSWVCTGLTAGSLCFKHLQLPVDEGVLRVIWPNSWNSWKCLGLSLISSCRDLERGLAKRVRCCQLILCQPVWMSLISAESKEEYRSSASDDYSNNKEDSAGFVSMFLMCIYEVGVVKYKSCRVHQKGPTDATDENAGLWHRNMSSLLRSCSGFRLVNTSLETSNRPCY